MFSPEKSACKFKIFGRFSEPMVEVQAKLEPLSPTRNDQLTNGHLSGEVKLETVKEEIKYENGSAELESKEKKKKHKDKDKKKKKDKHKEKKEKHRNKEEKKLKKVKCIIESYIFIVLKRRSASPF